MSEPNPTVDKQKILVDEIARRTFANDLDWNYGFSESDFSAALGKYQVNISEHETDISNDIIIKILQDGREIDRFSDVTLSGKEPDIPEFSNYYGLLLELHRRAGRIASGAEAVLDAILDELGLNGQ